ncbi:Dam family site-specific DNA-(adenine-N6)-methyltransferase [Campylobacter vulpis]|uniref:DNA adenine methylase n=1 Tax=Campylobacter vulpis TaxID=1655500 RepID=UPI001BCD6CC4|nr:Dam family site-specific DNA-(adenine-N6)-methyltransferase [Campylobacter vulpis]MBS4252896.1 Dam family site-specific DNA-(adenine-N6)-methyltransferase [Campylobacter vulpis]MBS4282224.1 Dam family site-specific DNA-(adenine-N6)-methyltransferase [Campylobacter vulpis]
MPYTKLKERFIASPLNYVGGKYRLLTQLFPLFPKDINIALDLFCGGANVGINMNARKIILNDSLSELTSLYQNLQQENPQIIFDTIYNIIDEFKLSNTAKYGYGFYQCDSAKGLSSYNKEPFLALRNCYNQTKNPFYLFVLIVFAFNNQIRFNAKREFNLPCGKRDFNQNMQNKLRRFITKLQDENITIFNKDFRDFPLEMLDSKSFVYIDPPYFLATAPYNKAWGKQDELDLLEFLRILDSKNIRFALSNVIFHKDREHHILKEWLEKHQKFKVHYLDFHYKNCNYQTKNAESNEVLVTNY